MPAQEEPRTEYLGHTIMLNAKKFTRYANQYNLYDKVFREARQAGGLAGYAHFFYKKPCCNARLGHVLDFADGMVDFIELIDDTNVWDPELYYEVLNMGFRPTALAGSSISMLNIQLPEPVFGKHSFVKKIYFEK